MSIPPHLADCRTLETCSNSRPWDILSCCAQCRALPECRMLKTSGDTGQCDILSPLDTGKPLERLGTVHAMSIGMRLHEAFAAVGYFTCHFVADPRPDFTGQCVTIAIKRGGVIVAKLNAWATPVDAVAWARSAAAGNLPGGGLAVE